MPTSNIRTPNSAKQFDAREAKITVGGDTIDYVESFGYDQSKDHELQYTVDQKAVWVQSTPELTGTFVMKATSGSIQRVEQLFLNDELFDIQADLASEHGQNMIRFVGCMMTDFSMSDYEIDGMPTVTGEWQGVNRGGNTIGRS